MTAQATQAEADTDDTTEERQLLPWVQMTPTSRIGGVVEGIIYAGTLSEHEKDTGTSFGVILSDPEVIEGELFRNDDKDEDGLTIAEQSDEGDIISRVTDYRVLDPEDAAVNVVEVGGEMVATDGHEVSNQYSPAETFDEDEVLVWFNGIAGQRIGRRLDFHGRPYAEYKADGYLNKGLLQFPEGWRNNRSEALDAGHRPRVARAPILRDDVEGERIEISLGRWEGGRMYEAHVYDDDGEELETLFDKNADDVLNSAGESGFRMHPYHGDGFQDKPDNAENASFDIQVEHAQTDVEGLTPQQNRFVGEVVQALEGTDLEPDEAFNGGLAGLAERNDISGNLESIEEAVYEQSEHLDPSDL